MTTMNYKCILCGGNNYTPIYSRDKWKIYKCNICGLGFLNPKPDENELSKLYQREYFKNHYNEKCKVNSAEMKKRLAQETHRLRFFKKFKKQGKILDIGCGRGYFLLACREKGYDTSGVDISPDVAEYVSKELNIPISTGEVSNIEFPR